MGRKGGEWCGITSESRRRPDDSHAHGWLTSISTSLSALIQAVFKSLKTTSKGGAAAMKDIEIVSSGKGPSVQLHGDAEKVAAEAGIKSFELSLSHADGVALAVALAKN